MTFPKLRRMSPSNAETAEYEGTLPSGLRVRVTRLTDPNADGGKPETRWDGFVWSEEHQQWSAVAECFGSRRAALDEAQRFVARHPELVG